MTDLIVDAAATLHCVGEDRELLGELAALFLEECPRQLAGIRAALESHDCHKLQIAAHTMKGSVSTFGALAATQAALRLEVLARSGSLAGAEDLLAELELALEPVGTVLAGWAAGAAVKS